MRNWIYTISIYPCIYMYIYTKRVTKWILFHMKYTELFLQFGRPCLREFMLNYLWQLSSNNSDQGRLLWNLKFICNRVIFDAKLHPRDIQVYKRRQHFNINIQYFIDHKRQIQIHIVNVRKIVLSQDQSVTQRRCAMTETFKNTGKKQTFGQIQISHGETSQPPSPLLEETVNVGDVKCGKATYHQFNMVVSY